MPAMTFAALACLLVGSLPVFPANTKHSMWSKEGYQQLRFGMGIGDVEAALKAPGFSLSSKQALAVCKPGFSSSLGERSDEAEGDNNVCRTVNAHSVTVSGWPLDVNLMFQSGLLYEVSLLPSFRVTDLKRERAVQDVVAAALEMLSKKHGTPKALSNELLEWQRLDMRVSLDKRNGCVVYRSEEVFEKAYQEAAKWKSSERERERGNL